MTADVIQFPHNDHFSVAFAVSEAMEKRYTREQIELGARISFFSALAIDPDGYDSDLKDEEVTVDWLNNWHPSTYPHKLIHVHARVGIPSNPQEGRSAETED